MGQDFFTRKRLGKSLADIEVLHHLILRVKAQPPRGIFKAGHSAARFLGFFDQVGGHGDGVHGSIRQSGHGVGNIDLFVADAELDVGRERFAIAGIAGGTAQIDVGTVLPAVSAVDGKGAVAQ